MKDLIDKTLGKLLKRKIADLYPDIRVTTIEKGLGDLLNAEYIK